MLMFLGGLFGGGASRPAPQQPQQAEPQPKPKAEPQPQPQPKDAATAGGTQGPTETDGAKASRGAEGSAPPPTSSRPNEAGANATVARDDARRGAAAETLVAISAEAPEAAAVEATEARAMAEAAVSAAKQAAILDRATAATEPAVSTLLAEARPEGNAADGAGREAAAAREASPFAKEVETVRQIERPAPERAIDRRL